MRTLITVPMPIALAHVPQNKAGATPHHSKRDLAATVDLAAAADLAATAELAAAATAELDATATHQVFVFFAA
jgi:hypothetical protein